MTDTQEQLCCSLDARALEERRDLFRQRLTGEVLSTERIDGGLLIGLRNAPEVREDVVQIIELERQCCGFLDFELGEKNEQLTLTITGPATANAVLENFETALCSLSRP